MELEISAASADGFSQKLQVSLLYRCIVD